MPLGINFEAFSAAASDPGAVIAIPAGSYTKDLLFVAHDSAGALGTPSGWTYLDSWTGTGVSFWAWKKDHDGASSVTLATPHADGLALTIGVPSDLDGTETITDPDPVDPTTFNSGTVSYGEADRSAVVLLAAVDDDPAGDFHLLAYDDSAGQGLELGVWQYDAPTSHSGEWTTTTVDPNERYIAGFFFGFTDLRSRWTVGKVGWRG